GMDRKLQAAPVDEDAEQDTAGSAEVGELVQRGAYRAPGEEDVIDDRHDLPLDPRLGESGLAHDRPRADRHQVVAVEGDVQGAGSDGDAFGALDLGGEPVGEVYSAAVDAHESEVLDAAYLLHQLVGHTGDDTPDPPLVEKDLAVGFGHGASVRGEGLEAPK